MRLRLAVVAAVAALTLAQTGCTVLDVEPTPGQSASARATPVGPDTSPTPGIPDAWEPLLRRPLQLPSVRSGEPCPTTKSSATPDWIGPVLGDGPIYPAFLGSEGVFTVGSFFVHEQAGWYTAVDWYGKKTLWVSDASYHGIALVRGWRLDGTGGVRFTEGPGPLVPALRLTLDGWVTGHGAEPGWREWNTGSWFTGPGCYAYQVDGDSFTDVIVVEVLVEAP